MMLLALDTTAAVATAALFRDGALVAEREADAGKKHAETALPLIETILEENGVTIKQIDLFAVLEPGLVGEPGVLPRRTTEDAPPLSQARQMGSGANAAIKGIDRFWRN